MGGDGRDWGKVAKKPSGTGPWMLETLKPRERADLVRNPNHWDKTRIPKCDRLVLLPMPDAQHARRCALSGQVDWIEAPPPDAVPRLKQQRHADRHQRLSAYLAVSAQRPRQFAVQGHSRPQGGQSRDRPRRARARCSADLATPAKGMIDERHPVVRQADVRIKIRSEGAKRLLAEAGYGPDKPVKCKIVISPSGSGQMQPLPMNEFIKDNFKEVGIDMEFEVMDWEALRTRRRLGAWAPENKGCHGVNNSLGLLGSRYRVDRGCGFDSCRCLRL